MAEDKNPMIYEAMEILPIVETLASSINKKSNTEPPMIEGMDNKNENLTN